MGKYNIKSIEDLTGIKAHTLRIWEQRYQLVIPHRTETNIRFYDDKQLQEILTIGLLYDNGLKISKIAKLSKEDRRKKVQELERKIPEYDLIVFELVEATIEYNQDKFRSTLRSTINNLGFEKTMLEVIHPFLYKVGVLWMTAKISPGQEHFASSLIRSEFILRIDRSESKNSVSKSTVVLFLPENELHELGILFAHYLLSRNGHRVVYLGADVPMQSVMDCYRNMNASYLLTVTTVPFKRKKAVDYFSELKSQGVQLIVAGTQIDSEVKEIDGIVVLDNLEDSILKLNQLT